jgi:3-oxoacyl-[acyl-carrier protein] reductase
MTFPVDLAGKTALVCGASKGIGRATAILLAQMGASVTVLARTQAALEAVVKEIHDLGAPKAHALVADLDDLDGLKSILSHHIEAHGSFHIWVNNTGGPPGGPLTDATTDTIAASISRHVLAPQVMLKCLLPGMSAHGYGRIINVLSTSVREPIPNLGVSNLTRAAVASWAKTLSRELPPGLTINNVLPGFTATGRLATLAKGKADRGGQSVDNVYDQWIAQVPEGRLGEPTELAYAIAFLASPAASFIRGTTLPVDGGRLRSI